MENRLIPNRLRFYCRLFQNTVWTSFSHCARHTYAVLQLANGTDIYTVSKMLGKAKQTVYTLSRLGEIPSCRQGRKAYFYEDELLAWINNGKIKTAQEIKEDAERAIYWGTRHGRQHNTLS